MVRLLTQVVAFRYFVYLAPVITLQHIKSDVSNPMWIPNFFLALLYIVEGLRWSSRASIVRYSQQDKCSSMSVESEVVE